MPIPRARWMIAGTIVFLSAATSQYVRRQHAEHRTLAEARQLLLGDFDAALLSSPVHPDEAARDEIELAERQNLSRGVVPREALLALMRSAMAKGQFADAVERGRELREIDPRSGVHLAAAYLLRYRSTHQPIDLALALDEIGRTTSFESKTFADCYVTASAYESIGARHLARDEWAHCRSMPAADPRGKSDAQRYWSITNGALTERLRLQAVLSQGPLAFLHYKGAKQYEPESVLEALTACWLPLAATDPAELAALRRVGMQFEKVYRDTWVSDLFAGEAAQTDRRAMAALAKGAAANTAGDTRTGMQSANAAIAFFHLSGNRAGEMRSRLERIYSLDRQGKYPLCLTESTRLRGDLEATRYVWLKGQTWLETSACGNGAGDVGRKIEEREAALQWITNTGYEGLRLRVLGFLLQPELVRANPVRIWRLAEDGLGEFWRHELPATRAQQFALAAAMAAKDGPFIFAPVVMGREALQVMEEIPNREWRGLCTAIVGSLEAGAGLNAAAEKSYAGAQELFGRSPATKASFRYRLAATLFEAEGEIAAKKPAEALAHLLTERRDFEKGGDAESSPFHQVTGRAYLALGRNREAAKEFSKAVAEAVSAAASIKGKSERYAQITKADASFRGLIYLQLVVNGDTRSAHATYLRWRAAAVGASGEAVSADPTHFTVPL